VHEEHNRGPDRLIVKAKNLIKKRIRCEVRVTNAKASDVSKALRVLMGRGLDPSNPERLKNLLGDISSDCNCIQERRDDLFRLDKALCQLDLTWLNRTHAFMVTRMTLAKRKILQENIIEERRRARMKETIDRLELDINLHIGALNDSIRSAGQCLEQEDMSGATGWIYMALQEHEREPELLAKIKEFEHRLLMLLTREKRELQ